MIFYPAYSQVTFSGGNISGNNVSKNLDNNFNDNIIKDIKSVNGKCDSNIMSKVSSQLDYSNNFSLKNHMIVETKIPQYRSYSFAETNPTIGGEVSPEIIAVGDLNNDSIDDIVIDYYETSLPPVILLGSKNGKFIELKYNTKNASRRHIRNAELADLNNDGWLDFIGFTTGDSSKIWEKSGYSTFGNSIPRGQEDLVLMNNQGKNFYELIVPEVRKNDWNHGGTIADLNNDGWLDILPLSEGEKEFTVPLENLNGKEFILGEYEYSKDISYYLTSDIDVVFHLAALARVQPSIEDPFPYHHVNVTATLNVLYAAHKSNVKKVVYSASSSCYGNTDIIPQSEDDPTNPLSPYGLQKYIGEQYCRMFSHVYDLDTVCLRYFNVYGERMSLEGAYCLVTGIFARQMKQGKPLTITNDGHQRRDFTYVGDVVQANILAANYHKKLKGEVFNIGNGKSISINDVADMFGGKKVYGEKRLEPFETLANNQKAKSILKWRPLGDLEDWIKQYKIELGI